MDKAKQDMLDDAKRELDALFAKYGQTAMAGVLYVALYEHAECRKTIGGVIRERDGNTAADSWAMAVCPCVKCVMARSLCDAFTSSISAPSRPAGATEH